MVDKIERGWERWGGASADGASGGINGEAAEK